MNTDKRVSATSGLNSWHSINWFKFITGSRKLQIRIAKAQQRMLTRFFSAKATAVRRVTENNERRTPGVGKQTRSIPEAKWNALNGLKIKWYKPLPLRRINIPKANRKLRPLGIPTMKDRVMQALFLLAIEPLSEIRAGHNSFVFRPARSTADAIEQIFITCAKTASPSPIWILEGDIKGCFDNISHDWLLVNTGNVPKPDKLPAEPSMKNNSRNTSGGIIYPVLANMVLGGLGKVLQTTFGETATRQSRKNKVNFVRYGMRMILS